MGFSPRKRARSEVPHIKAWPEVEGAPRLQGFAGYKAGMTHAMIVDYRKTSTTANKLVRIPVSVVEVPPMNIFAVRFYENTPYGHRILTEVMADTIDPRLANRFPLPKTKAPAQDTLKEIGQKYGAGEIADVRVLANTQPAVVHAIPKKTPEVMEIRVGGGSIDERIEYAANILGKTISISKFTETGDMIDVLAVTKGKGFQGSVKRWGVKLLTHKNSKHRRMTGNQGPFTPGYIRATVPQAGQTGYHQRTEFNKRVVKVVRVQDQIKASMEKGKDAKRAEELFKEPPVTDGAWKGDSTYLWRTAEGEDRYWTWKDKPGNRSNDGNTRSKRSKIESAPMDDGITPNGGFLNYGNLSTDYVLIHGSIPGPTKRMVRLRNPVRSQFTEKLKDPPKLIFISRESKQGV
jgi:large subunit ribosomal protein L3